MGIPRGGLTETNAVDQAGMVQGVADDGIPFVEQGFEQSAVGIEAGAVENRVIGAEKGADGLLGAVCGVAVSRR